ncbi:MAG: hypothetical protein IMY76_04610 [Chloroflexi bacterium]|nr:hypothetical protein [Chloroflexota bacterium]
MLKKIVLWSLYVAFVGVLIIGALNRTVAKNTDDNRAPNSSANDHIDSSTQHQDETIESSRDENAVHDETEYDWMTLTGTVSSILPRGMLVAEDDGQLIEVARRTWRFAQEQGFAPQIGDQVVLDGFYEGGEFELARLTNLTNGQTVSLRDQTGHPLWEGGGN